MQMRARHRFPWLLTPRYALLDLALREGMLGFAFTLRATICRTEGTMEACSMVATRHTKEEESSSPGLLLDAPAGAAASTAGKPAAWPRFFRKVTLASAWLRQQARGLWSWRGGGGGHGKWHKAPPFTFPPHHPALSQSPFTASGGTDTLRDGSTQVRRTLLKYTMSKRRRGMSLEEKRQVMLDMLQESKEPFLLKELEKLGGKKGVGG